MIKQQLITDEKKRGIIPRITHGKPQYNAIKGKIQRIELHRGCPWADVHEYCYEPVESTDFPIPEITMNQVQILDMNPLARDDILDIIKELGSKRANKRIIKYEFVCGVHFDLLTQEIADAMKKSRFLRPRLAWDGPFSDQVKIKTAIKRFTKAGYKRNELMLFMIVNWRIPYTECLRKLDLMKVWNVKVCDCCYDGGYKNAVPIYWTQTEMEDIRLKSRKHNHLVLFRIDPQPTIDQYRNGVILPLNYDSAQEGGEESK